MNILDNRIPVLTSGNYTEVKGWLEKVDIIRCPKCNRMMSYSYENSEVLHCGNCGVYILLEDQCEVCGTC